MIVLEIYNNNDQQDKFRLVIW